MEKGNDHETKEITEIPKNITIRSVLGLLMANTDGDEKKKVISLGIGDPTAYSCFRTTDAAKQVVADSLLSDKYNGYPPAVGLPRTREAIADYLSRDIPYKVSANDVYITAGCTQAIEIVLTILARPGANILLPRPGFSIYSLCAAFRNLEIRYYDLLPEKGWEVDLSAVESLANENTVGLVVINPGNPCANVYSHQHLEKIAQTAKRLQTVVVADEVYGHLAFDENPFVPMAAFSSLVPVLTLGSLSKRWLVPGWRLGWFVINDPNAIFVNPKFMERIRNYCDICRGPATFIQAAVPAIIEQTTETFYQKTISMLKHTSNLCYEKIKEIPWLICPCKPQGAMFLMVKLNCPQLEDISDDLDFCFKLAKEESVIILPGVAVGMRNWVRITFAVEPSSLEEALARVKCFCLNHTKQENGHTPSID
uniref:Aromatic amino acid aminotransferase 4 n=1 Tax=Atropa belladonna TaxID=33113 RepID=A0A0D3LQY6_ATRBE|nr:aromatic amino acid aminotransferase 4 [Atropa belladonna]